MNKTVTTSLTVLNVVRCVRFNSVNISFCCKNPYNIDMTHYIYLCDKRINDLERENQIDSKFHGKSFLFLLPRVEVSYFLNAKNHCSSFCSPSHIEASPSCLKKDN